MSLPRTALLVAALITGTTAGGLDAQAPQATATFVAVAAADGAPVTGLTAADFGLTEGKRLMPATAARPATDPPAVVIIADGYSMAYASELRRALKGLIKEIGDARSDAEIGLMIAEGPTPPTLVRVGTGAETLEKAAARFVSSGRSAPLLETIRVAAHTLERHASRRRVIFVMTNPWESVSPTVTAQELIEPLRRSGASLWVHQSTWETEYSSESENDRALRTLPALSGGHRQIIRATWVEPHVVALARVFLGQYEVTYPVPPDSGTWKPAVKQPGLRVFAPSWPASNVSQQR